MKKLLLTLGLISGFSSLAVAGETYTLERQPGLSRLAY